MTSNTEPAFLSAVLAPARESLAARREARPGGRSWTALLDNPRLRTALPVALTLCLAAFLRFWQLDRVGFNSDEAVYTGTAASLAGDDVLRQMFPVFRAHPVLLQLLVSFGQYGGVSDWAARAVAAGIGVAAVLATYLLGRRLYDHRIGLLAALIIAVMPYHVVVSRQVLLDGLMTLCATLVLYCVARYVESAALHWMLASCAVMGLTVLAKETSLVLVGGLYAFFALTPSVRIRLRHVGLGLLVMIAVVAAFPLSMSLSDRASSGQNYLLWQLFRRSNHEPWFYAEVLPPAFGWLTLLLAVVGLVLSRGHNTWRERLLLTWLAVPVVFFTVWPVKGYQYLLPIAPVIAILAARAVVRVSTLAALRRRGQKIATGASLALVLVLVISLLVPTWSRIQPSTSGTYLAGTGGLPGGREAGRWLEQNVPPSTQLLAIGPSMANVLQFYGHRRVFALSVSTDPANRNPSYQPVPNPDLAMRQARFQYLVWDSYTAGRSPSFSAKLTALVAKYHGVAVFTSPVTVRAKSGQPVEVPVVVIYRVRPA
ncbi:MAG TPA: glycosyltransferase family 39 protein [Jatrophihabitans sp.]|jgi:4-amino-4-deoxy-L-arabinose transferase-like glycosyltransferase|uniref:ArnT family glycosyltransferase n=1 Tax=Jatrophihabitans sp. TaxID=1932789 RepID=UPI002F1D5267